MYRVAWASVRECSLSGTSGSTGIYDQGHRPAEGMLTPTGTVRRHQFLGRARAKFGQVTFILEARYEGFSIEMGTEEDRVQWDLQPQGWLINRWLQVNADGPGRSEAQSASGQLPAARGRTRNEARHVAECSTTERTNSHGERRLESSCGFRQKTRRGDGIHRRRREMGGLPS